MLYIHFITHEMQQQNTKRQTDRKAEKEQAYKHLKTDSKITVIDLLATNCCLAAY